MIKPIKFDLKLSNGTKLATLDDLEENLSPALFEHFHSGKLAKWLRVRKLEELADKMETLQTEYLEYKNELDVQLFKKLCEVFVSEVDLDDAREAIAEFHALPVVQIENTEESKDLMVIEQPKTKEFRVNERLLYKTLMALGGSTYIKGETLSEWQVKFLEKVDVDVKDVLIFCREEYGSDGFFLTNDCLFIEKKPHYYDNGYKSWFRIDLKNIYSISYSWVWDSRNNECVVFSINREFFYSSDEYTKKKYPLLHDFLIDYLALSFEDNIATLIFKPE